ncbi:hypothetical protein BC835DRAFT_823531 [Cytidiella melzeri]|nr:hypothetical protein BC835DRAFT_823531 [Cytidiella melzeri]
MNATQDLRHAAELAVGTEIQQRRKTEDGGFILDEVRQYYYSVAQPILTRENIAATLSERPYLVSLSGFLHAYTLVSSRAFLIDAYHGLSMVPIADAFNHIQENHVHLESEYDVCASCGSLEQCPHDQDDVGEIIGQSRSAQVESMATAVDHTDSAQERSSKLRSKKTASSSEASHEVTSKVAKGIYAPAALSSSDEEDTCDMVSNLPIPPGSEVFNTYGEHLTNAQLLARYGFALDGNENDVVTFDVDDLPNPQLGLPGLDGIGNGVIDTARHVLCSWPRYERWEASSLVYHANASSPEEPSIKLYEATDSRAVGLKVPDHCRASALSPMCINSDARISHELWVCCALCSLAQLRTVFPTVDEISAVLVRLADRQLYWEAQSELDVEVGADASDDKGDRDLHGSQGVTKVLDKTLALLAQTVTWICTFSPRSRRLGLAQAVATESHIAVSHTNSDMDVDSSSDDDDNAAPSIEELGDMLDALPPTRPYTRLALQQVISERCILNSCQCGWEELREHLVGGTACWNNVDCIKLCSDV